MRTKTCPTCQQSFSYAIGRGRDRKHCSPKCRIDAQIALRARALQAGPWPICAFENCGKPATGPHAKYCKACVEQRRRTGGFSRKPHKGRTIRPNGYTTVVQLGHWLSDRHGRVYEHRLVLYNKCNGKDPCCFWCGSALRWKVSRLSADAVVVDHLNEAKGDNRPDNLVPACIACNRARGAMLPFLRRLTPQAFEVFISLCAQCGSRKSQAGL